MTDEQIKQMVDRFLQWKLPEDFIPDCGITFKKECNEHTAHPSCHEPTGTNLFSAAQAEKMVRFMVADLATPAVPREQIEGHIRAAFMEGFARSAEGWNGEFGATVRQVEEEAAKYLEAALGEKHG